MHTLEDKSVMITGASRGIGKAIALALAEQRMRLALVGTRADRLAETVAECAERGGKAFAIAADISQTRELPALVQSAVGQLGNLHVLVNNAGVHGSGPADVADLAKWDRAIDVNLRALMHLTRLALPEIEKNGWGAVVNVASVAARLTSKGSAAYVATKHAVLGFSGSVFEDIREKNIKVCTICPGYVNTDLLGKAPVDRAKTIQPSDVADAVLYVLRSSAHCCPTEITLRPQRSPYLPK